MSLLASLWGNQQSRLGSLDPWARQSPPLLSLRGPLPAIGAVPTSSSPLICTRRYSVLVPGSSTETLQIGAECPETSNGNTAIQSGSLETNEMALGIGVKTPVTSIIALETDSEGPAISTQHPAVVSSSPGTDDRILVTTVGALVTDIRPGVALWHWGSLLHWHGILEMKSLFSRRGLHGERE